MGSLHSFVPRISHRTAVVKQGLRGVAYERASCDKRASLSLFCEVSPIGMSLLGRARFLVIFKGLHTLLGHESNRISVGSY